MATDAQAGAQRRLQGTRRTGWSATAIERATGLPARVTVRALVRRDTIRPSTVERAAVIYERLWDQPPPLRTAYDRKLADQAAAVASRRGWPPPMGWG